MTDGTPGVADGGPGVAEATPGVAEGSLAPGVAEGLAGMAESSGIVAWISALFTAAKYVRKRVLRRY